MRREGEEKTKACHVKCDACPVKFEARKYFNREGAYFTVGKSEEKRKVNSQQSTVGNRHIGSWQLAKTLKQANFKKEKEKCH